MHGPGHARGKQGRMSNWPPAQPPPGSASLAMSLWRNREPRPQETLQRLHTVHVEMMQSTGQGKQITYRDILRIHQMDELLSIISPARHQHYITTHSFDPAPWGELRACFTSALIKTNMLFIDCRR